MPLAYFFWGFAVAAIFLGLWANYDGQPLWYRRGGAYLVMWILIILLGFRVFGHPVQ
jgi:hypothetical protein